MIQEKGDSVANVVNTRTKPRMTTMFASMGLRGSSRAVAMTPIVHTVDRTATTFSQRPPSAAVPVGRLCHWASGETR